MIPNRLSIYGTLASLTLLGVMGCLTRKETIKIARDGAVTIAVSCEGSREELDTVDALPSASGGWDRVTIQDVSFKENKQRLEAERTFAPGEDLPGSYASMNDPDTDLYLAFPTTLRIEPRTDGVYYYLHRVYTPRRWGYVQVWKDAFIDDSIKKLGEKPAEELNLDEKRQIVQAFAGVEAYKQIEFAKTALEECEPDLQPEYWLLARRALLDIYEEDNDYFNTVIELCEQAPEDGRGECFNQEAERILAEGYAAFVQSLRGDAGFTRNRITRFEQAYDRAVRYYRITEELGGHHFEIKVEMPGVVIAHNGDHEDHEGETSVVKWSFDGKAFRDRPHELQAISRLEEGAESESQDAVDDNGQ